MSLAAQPTPTPVAPPSIDQVEQRLEGTHDDVEQLFWNEMVEAGGNEDGPALDWSAAAADNDESEEAPGPRPKVGEEPRPPLQTPNDPIKPGNKEPLPDDNIPDPTNPDQTPNPNDPPRELPDREDLPGAPKKPDPDADPREGPPTDRPAEVPPEHQEHPDPRHEDVRQELAQLRAELAALKAPTTEQAPIDYVKAFDTDPGVREAALRALQFVDERGQVVESPYAIMLARQELVVRQQEQRIAQQEAQFQQYRRELEQRATEAEFDSVFTREFAAYEADADIREAFRKSALSAVRAGHKPDAAVKLMLNSPIAKLLPKKSAAPAAPAQPRDANGQFIPKQAAALATPAAPKSLHQQRLESAVAVAGRGAQRAAPQKGTTKSLQALEGGRGWTQ